MDFSYCEFLTKFPDVSRIPNLEKLTLNCCTNLVEVHHSVGFLDKLILLSVMECFKLMSFPRRLKLKYLESLLVSSCSRLNSFPEFECQMEYLGHIKFKDTGIRELSSSIQCLSMIKTLDLEGCSNLLTLPHSICDLQYLEILNLSRCSKLEQILELPPKVVKVNAWRCVSLAKFDPGPFQLLSNLLKWPLGNYDLTIPPSLCQFDSYSCLEEIDLSGSAIVSLPSELSTFMRLKLIFLIDCKKLHTIPSLPPNIEKVYAGGCTSLESCEFDGKCDLPMLDWFDFSGCHKLIEIMGDDLQIRIMSEVTRSLSHI